ncbi:MAG: M56 family metallopeptidase [Planctomycetota bacterium]|nr:M56 family metallopeptidase [Planctomycetota bacterium]
MNNIDFVATAWLLIDLAWKSTVLLLLAVGIDRALLRKRPLIADTMWFTVLAALLLLVPVSLLTPAVVDWREAIWPTTTGVELAQETLPVQQPEPAPTEDNAALLPGEQEFADPGFDPAAESDGNFADAGVPVPVEAAAIASENETTEPASTGFQLTSDSAGAAAVVVQIAVMLLLLVRLFGCYRQARGLAAGAAPVTQATWTERMRLHAAQLRLRKPIVLAASERVAVPTALGWRVPTILLPASTVGSAKPAAIDAILLHELVHIARRDYLLQIGWKLCQCIYWWNPLVWYGARRAAELREVITDGVCVTMLSAEQVVPSSRADYIGVLLGAAKGLSARQVPTLVVPMARTSQLQRRLEFIRNLSVRMPLAGQRIRRGLLFVGLVVLAAVGIVQAVDVPKGEEPKDIAFAPPELKYLEWQWPITEYANTTSPYRMYWDRTGNTLTEEEYAKADLKKTIATPISHSADYLRPLKFFYKTAIPCEPGTITTKAIVGGKPLGNDGSRKWDDGLYQCDVKPLKSDLSAWPEKISLEVTYPRELPQVFHTIEKITDAPVQVAPGATVYLEPEQAIKNDPSLDPKSKPMGPWRDTKLIGIVRTTGKADVPTKYSPRFVLKSSDAVLASFSDMQSNQKTGETICWLYCKPIAADDIAKVEILRQRFDKKILKDIPLRVQDLPESERPKEAAEKAADGAAIAPPELLYLGWQRQEEPHGQVGFPSRVWDRQGGAVTEEEFNNSGLKSADITMIGRRPDQLIPLRLFFRNQTPPNVKSFVATVIAADGTPHPGGNWASNIKENGRDTPLAVSYVCPNRKTLSAWPEKINLEVRYQIEDWTAVRELTEIPKDPVEVADGITWYLDAEMAKKYAQSGAHEGVFPQKPLVENGVSSVLKMTASAAAGGKPSAPATDGQPNAMPHFDKTEYRARVFRKDGSEVKVNLAMGIDDAQRVPWTYRISEPIAGPEEIDRVVFERQRSRKSIIKDIPLRVQDLPESERPKGAAVSEKAPDGAAIAPPESERPKEAEFKPVSAVITRVLPIEDRREIAVDNAADAQKLTAFFPGIGERRKSDKRFKWVTELEIRFKDDAKKEHAVDVDLRGDLWREGNGDWPIENPADLKKLLDELEKKYANATKKVTGEGQSPDATKAFAVPKGDKPPSADARTAKGTPSPAPSKPTDMNPALNERQKMIAAHSDHSKAVITVEPDKPEYFLGENVLLHWNIRNDGEKPFWYSIGGDGRTPYANRAIRFKIEMTDEKGNAGVDPYPNPGNHGGHGMDGLMQPKGEYADDIQLMRYREVTTPGEYTIKVYHDLDWEKHAFRRKYELRESSNIPPEPRQGPVVTTKIRLKMPTAEQAREVVEAMMKLPKDGSRSMGKKGAAYADFELLRYPVYLPIAKELVAKGDMRGLDMLGRMAFPEATTALIELMSQQDPVIAGKAADLVFARAPIPPGYGPSSRTYLADRSWNDDLKKSVMTQAWKLLNGNNGKGISRGARVVQSLGTADDFPVFVEAMDKVLEKYKDNEVDQRAYLRPVSPTNSVVSAAEILLKRTAPTEIPLPATPGGAVIWLLKLGSDEKFRPAGWRETARGLIEHEIPYIRELALLNQPLPLDDATTAAVIRAIRSDYPPVQGAACDLAAKAKLKEFGPAVLQVVGSTKNQWVLDAAFRAADACGVEKDRPLEILARRLTTNEKDWNTLILRQLVDGSIKSNGGYTPDVQNWGAIVGGIRTAWLKFISANREDLRAGRLVEIDSPALSLKMFPDGYELHQNGKPSWPVKSAP